MSDTSVRLSIFLLLLVILLLLESLVPARQSPITKAHRWLGNFGLLFISSLFARLILPIGLTGVALYCTQQSYGLFNVIPWLNNLSNSVIIIVSLLILDMVIYWQHRLFHCVPILWRLHKVHHADSHVDASTGLRFHPIEIALSLGLKALVVIILGIPASAVIIFEVALNGFALFNHANIRLPNYLEIPLRKIIITQTLHRIHHSQVVNETNSNYGFSISWWDKLFNSYRHTATKSDEQIVIGLKEYPANNKNTAVTTLLKMPLNSKK